MKSMPRIEKVMTSMPHTVGAEQPLKVAKQMMSEYHIRHLPVLRGGLLVGVISDRDVSLATSFEGGAESKIDDVMMPSVYAVPPETPVDQVVVEMAEKKYGSAIVQQQNGRVVGIFTAIDGLMFLADVLKEHYKGV